MMKEGTKVEMIRERREVEMMRAYPNLMSKCCVVICIKLCIRDTQGCSAYWCFVFRFNKI